MIKIKTFISENELNIDDLNFQVKKYETENTNTFEHLALINFLIIQIEKETNITRDKILKLLKKDYIEEIENGK